MARDTEFEEEQKENTCILLRLLLPIKGCFRQDKVTPLTDLEKTTTWTCGPTLSHCDLRKSLVANFQAHYCPGSSSSSSELTAI